MHFYFKLVLLSWILLAYRSLPVRTYSFCYRVDQPRNKTHFFPSLHARIKWKIRRLTPVFQGMHRETHLWWRSRIGWTSATGSQHLQLLLCQSSRELHFMLMFGRDPITLVAKLLEPKPRYYRERGSALKMDTLRRLYAVCIENIHKARSSKLQQIEVIPHSFTINDMVLAKDPDSAVFKPKYQPNYRVTAIFGDDRIEVQDEKGHKSIWRSSHVKYVEPSEKIVYQLPGKEMLSKYRRSSKALLTTKDIPDIHFNINGNSKLPESSQISLNPMAEVIEVMETKERPQNTCGLFSRNIQNSDNLKQMGNLPKNVVKEMLNGREVV